MVANDADMVPPKLAKERGRKPRFKEQRVKYDRRVQEQREER